MEGGAPEGQNYFQGKRFVFYCVFLIEFIGVTLVKNIL